MNIDVSRVVEKSLFARWCGGSILFLDQNTSYRTVIVQKLPCNWPMALLQALLIIICTVCPLSALLVYYVKGLLGQKGISRRGNVSPNINKCRSSPPEGLAAINLN